LNQADDVHLLDSEESIEDQVTFQFRLTGKEMDPEPGPSTSQDLDQPDTSVTYNIPGENGRLEFLDLKEPVLRQCSVTEYQKIRGRRKPLNAFNIKAPFWCGPSNWLIWLGESPWSGNFLQIQIPFPGLTKEL